MGYQKLGEALNDTVKNYTPDVLYPRECVIIGINVDGTVKIKVNIGEMIYIDEVRYIGIPKINEVGIFIPLNNNYNEGYCICYKETTESLIENVIINDESGKVSETLNQVNESIVEDDKNEQTSNVEEAQTSINYDKRYAKVNHTHNDNIGTLEDLRTLIKNTKEGNILSLDKNYSNERYANIIISKKIIIEGNGHTINNISLTCDNDETELNNIIFINISTNRNNGGVLQLNGRNISINNCIFYNNNITGTSVYEGGGISINNSSVNTKITNCYFINNYCSNNGGAIRWVGNDGKLLNSYFVGNASENNGGAIKWNGLNGYIRNCVFENNVSDNANDIYGTSDLLCIGNVFDDEDIVGTNKVYDYITQYEESEIYHKMYSSFGRNVLNNSQHILKNLPNGTSYSEEKFRNNDVIYFDDETTSSDGYRKIYYNLPIEFNHNDEMTLSFWIKGTEETLGKVKTYNYGHTNNYIKSKVIDTNGYNYLQTFGNGEVTFDMNTNWKKCYVTWKMDSVGNFGEDKWIEFRFYDGSEIYFTSPKLERGDIATDWTPNPNDKNDKTFSVCHTSSNSGYDNNGYAKVMKIKNINYTLYYNTPIGFDIYQKNKKFPVRCYLKFKTNSNDRNFEINSFYYYGEESEIYIINSANEEWEIYVRKTETDDIIEIKNFTINDSHLNEDDKIVFYPLSEEIRSIDFNYNETDTHSAKAIKSDYCLDKEQTDSYYLSLNGGNLNGNLNVNGNATANSIIRKNGTSSQFLKGDGSVDTSGRLINPTEQNKVSLLHYRNKINHYSDFDSHSGFPMPVNPPITIETGFWIFNGSGVDRIDYEWEMEFDMQFYSPNIVLKFFNNDKEWTTTNSFGITDGIKTYDTVDNKIHLKIVKTYEYWWRPKYQIFVNDDSEYFDANYDIDSDDFEISIFLTTDSNGFVVSEPILRYVSEEELDIIDMIYPVGSIYMSVNNIDPSTLFGGRWTQLKDRFLLGAGSTYTGGSTGGSKDAIVVSHSHKINRTNGQFVSRDGTKTGGIGEKGASSGTSFYAPSIQSDDNWYGVDSTASSGSSGTDKNMPPYLVVYMWKRIE